MLSNLLMQLGNHTNAQLDENMVRHMCLNSLRSYRMKFGDEYGELVIACDNGNYWRKQIFPYYKANRKKNNEASELDWKVIFECLNKIRAELKEFFPYKVIEVETAEADDIIATLCFEYGYNDQQIGRFTYFVDGELVKVPEEFAKPILIMSGDKDFIQLQVYPNVKQYSPVLKKYITHVDPVRYLQEHILKGDAGDGIPNILSSDNCFVVGERQKPMSAKRIETYIGMPFNEMPANIGRNYSRNLQLIDLSYIPLTIQTKILDEFEHTKNGDRSKLLNYFIKHKLKNLMENIQEF